MMARRRPVMGSQDRHRDLHRTDPERETIASTQSDSYRVC
jgi:hypothetical protein